MEQLYSQIEVTADDIAEVIAFVIGRPRRLAIHEEVSLRQPVRSMDETLVSCLGRSGGGQGKSGER